MNPLRLVVVSSVAGAAIVGAHLTDRGLLAQSAAMFAQADVEKDRALNDLGSSPAALSAAQVSDVIGTRIADGSAYVRERALWAIARRASAPPSLDVWLQERAILAPFKGRVAQLLRDKDSNVRIAAIAALSALELQLDRKDDPHTLSMEAAAVFERVVQQDPVEQVRAHAMRAFASYPVLPEFVPRRDAVVASALSGTSETLLQVGVIATGNQHIESALPLVAPLLKHQDAAVRGAAAQALAAFGSKARSYVPALQAALANESDDLVRSTLQGAINAIVQ
jgi:HEAT repeats